MGQLLAVKGSLRVKPRWLGPPPSTSVLLLFLRLLSLAIFSGRVKLGASFWPSFSHLSLNCDTPHESFPNTNQALPHHMTVIRRPPVSFTGSLSLCGLSEVGFPKRCRASRTGIPILCRYGSTLQSRLFGVFANFVNVKSRTGVEPHRNKLKITFLGAKPKTRLSQHLRPSTENSPKHRTTKTNFHSPTPYLSLLPKKNSTNITKKKPPAQTPSTTNPTTNKQNNETTIKQQHISPLCLTHPSTFKKTLEKSHIHQNRHTPLSRKTPDTAC